MAEAVGPGRAAARALVGELHARMRLPVLVAPMFLVSGPEIVIAAGKAGVLGGFPAPNTRTLEELDQWMTRIARALDDAGRGGMWAVNMIVNRNYARFDAELDLICEHRPRIVITALGDPRRPLARVHAYGGAVFADVTTPDQARKAADAGVDGLTLVASGAGGHTGHYSAFAFVEEVRAFWSGPLALGGAIGSGAAVRAAIALGADFVNMGTRFLAASESLISDANRDMLFRSTMRDIVTSAAVTGIASNWMRESLDAAGLTDEMLGQSAKIDFADVHGEAKAWKHIWGAGHAVGATRRPERVEEIVDLLCRDYAAANDHALDRWPREMANISGR